MTKVDKKNQGSAVLLLDLLSQYGLVKTEVWLGEGFNKNCKWDGVWNGIAIEFDGPYHYQKPAQIFRDTKKTAHAKDIGMGLIRFPYWLAVDAESVKHFFGLDTNAPHNFPHGFPTTNELPSSFCEKGVANFERDLALLSPNLKTAVIETLHKRAESLGIDWVLPSTLQYILSQSVDSKKIIPQR